MSPRRVVAPWAPILLSLALVAAGTGPADASSLLRKLLAIAGITPVPSQMRSEEVEPGSLWLVTVKSGAKRQVASGGDYLSPIFRPDGREILALRRGVVVAIPLSGGPPRTIKAMNQALKIVGFDSQNPQELLLLTTSVEAPLVSLSLADQSLQVLPFDRSSIEQQRLLGTIRNQDRVYGATKVFLQVERKEGLLRPVEWTDIYIAQGSAPVRNISQCDGVNCAQPALSADGQSIVFVKSDEGF